MKLRIKRKTLISSICAVLVTVSFMSKANRETTSDDVEFHTDLDRSLIADSEEILSDTENTSEEEIKAALHSEISQALSESELLNLDANAPKNRSIELFRFNDSEGLSFSNSNCRRFLKKDGSYGDFGRIIEDYLNEDLKDDPKGAILLSNSIRGMRDGPKICPNWAQLSEKQKIKFWVWTLASISFSESSCSPSPPPVFGPSDSTAGLLQLEAGTRKNSKGHFMGLALRKSRGPNCSAASTVDIKKPFSNLRCGLDMMKQQLTDTNRSDQTDFNYPIYPSAGMTAKSYWLKLRVAGGSTIGMNMRQFSPCF